MQLFTPAPLAGELADWFKKHPTCLEPAIRYLLSTTASPLLRFSGTTRHSLPLPLWPVLLANGPLPPAALTSLKQLTEKCGKHLHQVLEPMLTTYESLSDSFSVPLTPYRAMVLLVQGT